MVYGIVQRHGAALEISGLEQFRRLRR